MKRKARLEDWSIVNVENPFDPFAPNDAKMLVGYVVGHGEFEDNDPITTSQVLTLDISSRLAETRNTCYDLGKINESFKTFLVETKRIVDRYPDISILENL